MKKRIYFILTTIVVCLISSSAYSQPGQFGLSYSTAMPLGEVTDHIDKYSWRGIGMEARWEVATELYMGFNTSWNVYYESESGTFTKESTTVTGSQYRYLNTVPLMVTVFKNFETSGSLTPYIGTGVGTIYNEYRTDMGLFSVQSKGWQFGLAPEVGILIPVNYKSYLFLSVRYYYGVSTTQINAYSALGINLGVLF